MGLDVAMWVAAAATAARVGRPWATALAVAFIGAAPMHDILFHGHEGAHGRIARTRWLNTLGTWAAHALFGLSGSGYRAFHLEHHRFTHTDRDPEYRLMNRVAQGAPGLSWIAVPLASYLAVNVWPFRRAESPALRRRVALEIGAAAFLHVALAVGLGPNAYLTFVVLPAFSSLSIVVVLRSVCEHHGLPAGDRWTHARAMRMGPVLGFFWSNAGYHLEHHRFPSVPFHELPALREKSAREYRRHGVTVEAGYLRTGLRLLFERNHFSSARRPRPEPRPLVDKKSLPFRMKVLLFRDILTCPAARHHLFSIYYTGEAYEEIHPTGVYVEKLPPWLGRLLARHLSDETRHANVFRSLLAGEGAAPEALAPDEDVGWYCLTHTVPDVVAKAGGPEAFGEGEAMRYMAFLHALELRSTSDLFALIEAARGLGEEKVARTIESIVADERRHAAYTHAAVFRLASTDGEARRALARVLRAERAAYAQTLARILSRFRALGAEPENPGARLRWLAMRMLVRTGLAFPLLPMYERLPKRLAA
jgi:fatty acid desaturase